MADSDITIVGLQATGGQSQIVLSWAVDDPNIEGLPYLRFDHAEVRWAAAIDMASPTTLSGEVFTAAVDLPVPRGETRWYQVRAINREGQEGDWCDPVSAREISGDVLVASPGYWKLPNGLILQWGTSGSSDADGLSRADFALAFPNDCFACIPAAINTNQFYVISAALQEVELDHALFRFTYVSRQSPFGDETALLEDVIVGGTAEFIAIGY